MKKSIKLILSLLVLGFVLTACFNEDKNKVLDGVFSFEPKKGTNILLVDNKLATGIVKGHDDILNLEYEMKYHKGLPTGEIIFLNNDMKFIEMNIDFNYLNKIATGNIKIFDIDRDGNQIVSMEYNNIESNIENFIDLDKMKPSLNWYLDNLMNVYKTVEISSYGKKITYVKNGKCVYYDDDGQEIEINFKTNKESGEEILNEYVAELNNENNQEEEIDDNKEYTILYEDTEKTVKKVIVKSVEFLGSLSSTDEFNNVYEVYYENGLPTGEFKVSFTDNEDMFVNGNGKYDFEKDLWQGTIIIKNGNNTLKLANVIVRASEIFYDDNKISYKWLNINFNKDEALNISEIKNFIKADVFFNDEEIASIDNGIYEKKLK